MKADLRISIKDYRRGKNLKVLLVRVLWHLLKYKQPYNPEVFAQAEAKMKRKKLARLQTLAATLNYTLVQNQ